jgi:DNA-binding CsgD family transcriptional regulator
VHDIGKVGVSAEIWGKADPLSDREWEAVRLHPYYTSRVFARSTALARIGEIASLHHERLDGSGYFRSLPAAMQPATSRVLAAANRFRSLVEARAHREALSPEEAARQLRTEAGHKWLDEDAATAVLVAAGDARAWRTRTASATLSARETEVLRLLARGHTMKAAADQLQVAYKTVDRHVQNIYSKIEVRTRAGATLWAVEHGLI